MVLVWLKDKNKGVLTGHELKGFLLVSGIDKFLVSIAPLEQKGFNFFADLKGIKRFYVV